jgi:hypothetical protein
MWRVGHVLVLTFQGQRWLKADPRAPDDASSVAARQGQDLRGLFAVTYPGSTNPGSQRNTQRQCAPQTVPQQLRPNLTPRLKGLSLVLCSLSVAILEARARCSKDVRRWNYTFCRRYSGPVVRGQSDCGKRILGLLR